jgi:hypothetical protein
LTYKAKKEVKRVRELERQASSPESQMEENEVKVSEGRANDELGLLMEGEKNLWEQDYPLDDISVDGIDRYS